MTSYTITGYNKTINIKELKNPFKIKKGISIIIATYNEEGNLEPLLNAIKTNLSKTEFKNNYEIIIIDDDSKDKTPQIMDSLAKQGNVVALHRHNIRGLFSAILDGIKIANGKFILTLDADFSHPPELIPELLKYKDYDIVSGSRYIKGGGTEAPFLRSHGSKILNSICSSILGLTVKDLGGNFHLFKKSSLDKIKYRYPARFGEFSFETFYRAYKQGMKIKEIPFVYKFRKQGKSKMTGLAKTSFTYLKRAFQLRFESQ